MNHLKHDSGVTDGHTVYRRWRFLGYEYRSDLIAHDYMRRWALKTPWGTVRLHHILRGDEGRDFHDHPMDFVSLILKGGYTEYRPGAEPRRFLPGDILIRKAEDLHYLKLLEKSAWTFLITSPFRRKWGFATKDGWVVAGEYDAWLKAQDAKAAKTEGAL